MCWQYPAKFGLPRLCGTTPPEGPDLRLGLGLDVVFALGATMVGTLAEAEGVLRGCCLACVGEEDGVPVRDGEALAAADVLAARPAWSPSGDVAVPLPGETSTKAATMMPASRSGPNPKSRTLASRPRPRPQVTGRLAAPARP